MAATRDSLSCLDDPCERARILRAAFYDLVAGQATVETEYTANGVSRRVAFPDNSALERECRRAEDECAALRGPTPRVNRILFSCSKGY